MLLEQSKENAFLSEQLFTLRFYETYATKESFPFSADTWPKAYPFFQKYEFRSFLRGLKQKKRLPSHLVTIHEKYTF